MVSTTREISWRTLVSRRGERSAKIFRDDDVSGGLRPRSRHFDVLLLEDHPPVFTRDDRAAQIPFDLRIWIDPGSGEESLEHDPAAGRRRTDRSRAECRCAVGRFSLRIHLKIYRSPAHRHILPA